MPNLDTFIANIDAITTELKNIDNKTFTLEELMTDDFIKNHTPFFSFDNFLDKAPFEVNRYEDIENNIIEFNLYVSSVSEFENWDEMVEEALLSLLTLPE